MTQDTVRRLIVKIWKASAIAALFLLSGLGVAYLLGYYDPVNYDTLLGWSLIGLHMLIGSHIWYQIRPEQGS